LPGRGYALLSEFHWGINMLRSTRHLVRYQSSFRNAVACALCSAVALALGACGGGKSDSPAPPGPIPINVSVTGLLPGKTLVLKNGTETLTFSDNSTKAFPTAVPFNSVLAVSISTQPDVGQTCAIGSTAQTVNTTTYTLNVVCTPISYTISGIVYGLVAGQTLQLLNSFGSTVQATAPDASGQFSFNGKWGDSYSVTVLAQPTRELCSVKNGTGLVSANVSNLEVRCIGQVWNIYTAAGDGRPTSADSTNKSLTASFYAPQGIATDSSSGAILVADTNSGAIRKLIYDLTVPATLASTSTVAGISFLNGLNNDGSNSRFNGPVGVAVDASAFATTKTTTIYVADTGNHLIRTMKINADGSIIVATFAGSGIPAYLNETKEKAQFNRPTAIAVDSGGNLYVADTGNHAIRKITSAGVVSLFAGVPNSAGAVDGPVTSATFNSPMGVAVDSLGNVYVADTLNSTIRKISGGKVETLAGKAGIEGAKDGNRAAASFFRPTGIAIDSAFYLYVADTQNNIIRLVDQIGEVITIAGATSPGSLDSYPSATCISFNNCSLSGGSFNRPSGIAVNKLGDLFVADTGNNKIRYLTKTNPAPK